ncbi:DarT ssDNA thymidine ADP-ribosyltransferase family protein [Methylobacterium sp. CM6241]
MLDASVINEHIAHWEQRLTGGLYSYRCSWPSRLFHHAPINNAVEILKLNCLLSRNDSEGIRRHDIAGQEVIRTRTDAHSYSRLYFRPKTPTQFHIEGIRKPSEYWNNEPNAHASVLVMLVFDARTVLGKPDIAFSQGNMQSHSTQYGSGVDFFKTIDFFKVYHEGPTNGERSITHCRCAEVLVRSPLPLDNNLQWIFCRSQPERQMLLGMLGPAFKHYENKIRVSDDIRVFEKKYAYVEQINAQPDGIVWRLNPRLDGKTILTEVKLFDSDNHSIINFGPKELHPFPPNSRLWIIKHPLKAGQYYAEVKLEGCIAFSGMMTVAGDPF